MTLLPDARLICCLRQPVERAYADYLMYLWRRGRRFDPARDLTADAVRGPGPTPAGWM